MLSTESVTCLLTCMLITFTCFHYGVATSCVWQRENVYVSTCVCMCTWVHDCERKRVSTCVCVCVCICVYMHVCVATWGSLVVAWNMSSTSPGSVCKSNRSSNTALTSFAVHVRMYVCWCIYMCIYIHKCIYIYIYISAFSSVFPNYVHVYMWTFMYMYICQHMYMYIWQHRVWHT